jgi:hypothetical protein
MEMKRKGHYNFRGGMKNGQKQGYGVQKWDIGIICEGKFINNKLSGICKITSPGGKIFCGQFTNSKAHGYGILKNPLKGVTYEGEWELDAQHDICFEKWHDGSVFQGEYHEGKRNGLGTYITCDNTIYEGEWKDNDACGYVRLI